MKIVALGMAVLLCAAMPLAVPRSLRTWGLLVLGLSFVTISWNGVSIVGPVAPSDLLLLIALGIGLLHTLSIREFVRLPLAVVAGAGLIALSGLLSALFPTSQSYLTRRYNFVNPLEAFGGHEVGGSNLSQLTKFEIALLALPLAVLLLRPTGSQLLRLGDCFVLSAAISSVVGITDVLGLTSISPSLLGFTDITGRASGLTLQPNHLAASAVLALPLAVHGLFRVGRRWIAGPVVLLLLAGVVVTGSRGGSALAVLACLGCFVAFPPLRKRIWLTLAPLPLVLALRLPQHLLDAMQNRVGAQKSDNQRALLREQGIADFLSSPLHGTGFQNITAAHEVHVQLLAAGGVLAFVGYFLYLGGVGAALRRSARSDTLASALAVILGVNLLMHFVENQLTDRYLLVPVALALGVAAHQRSMATDGSNHDAAAQPETSSSDGIDSPGRQAVPAPFAARDPVLVGAVGRQIDAGRPLPAFSETDAVTSWPPRHSFDFLAGHHDQYRNGKESL